MLFFVTVFVVIARVAEQQHNFKMLLFAVFAVVKKYFCKK